MSTKSIKAGYLTTSWDEKTVSADDAAIKITRVRTERKFTGAMEGTGTCHFKGSIDEKTAIGGLKGLKGKGGYKHATDACWSDPTSVWLEYTL
ncbi:hypothetical protein FRC07_012531 [Ceratobasidium sp. 392]|nr:hypothetical protein FRC07_012531 [Ceratobasidium sp. 392]